MSKLSFTDILKTNSTLTSGKIREEKGELVTFITNTKKKQEDVLKLKHLNDQQLKIIIRL